MEVRFITKRESEQVIEQLTQELPNRILLYVALSDPCHPLHLRRQVESWFPGSPGSDLADRVEEITRWLEERGDLFVAPRGVLRCLPAYCVGDPGDPVLRSLPLYGHPGVEVGINRSLQQFGVQVHHQYTPDGLGLNRWLELPNASRTDIIEQLGKLCVRVFKPEEFLSNLSRVTELSLPVEEAFRDRPPAGGAWSTYSPDVGVPYQNGRWRPIGALAEAGDLVRWSPAESDGKPWMRRFFLHYDGGMVQEITSDLACWWQFVLDDLQERPTKWHYDDSTQELTINGNVPQAVSQILRFLSDIPVRTVGYERRFFIPSAQFHLLKRIGEEHLGVKVLRSSGNGG